MTDPTVPAPLVAYQYPADPPADGRLALIGEAPGAEEVRLGRPFVGRSGRLLDAALAEAGIDRNVCLVANVFRLQPPGNRVDHFFASRQKARREGFAVIEDLGPFGGSAFCRADYRPEIEHLAQVLAAFRPTVAVALGRTPLWALTGSAGLLKCRGMTLPCRLAVGIQVAPTFHPSYLLRGRHAEVVHFVEDLRRAAALATRPPLG